MFVVRGHRHFEVRYDSTVTGELGDALGSHLWLDALPYYTKALRDELAVKLLVKVMKREGKIG